MIRIVTDSSSDLDLDQAAQLQVDVIPIHIYFGQTEYLDRQDLSVTDFYTKLETVEQLPTTSQITPFQFYQTFQPYIEAGDEIVGIFLSGQLSGTFQSAQAAQQMLKTEQIHLVDSLNAALGHHLLIQIAVRLRDQGMSAQQIAQQLTELSKKSTLNLPCVKTMKYLVMGGRVSAAVAKIGKRIRHYTNHIFNRWQSRKRGKSARPQSSHSLDSTPVRKRTRSAAISCGIFSLRKSPWTG